MKTNLFSLVACIALSLPTTITHAQTSLTDSDLQNAYRTVSYNRRTSVHDPSIVIDTITNPNAATYYVFGSHMAVSKTTDLVNWTSNVCGGESTNAKLFGKRNSNGTISTCSYNDAYRTNEVTQVKVLRDGEPTMVDFGTYDAAAWNTAIDDFTVRGNQWASDVIYNPTMGKWLFYVSLNGSKWNSVIVCMAADKIEGPYVYQGPVVFSGFNVQGDSPSYADSDMPLVLGELSALPARYARGSKWGTFWPHAIDPAVFYDHEGKLWMTYGSWSGGIYMIELDETNGLRDYTVTYPAENNSSANVTSDPYFGKKIAGGYYVSGEGPYIERIGDYYFLFMSYGFYSPEGGYEMRVFRSKNPDGPYIDCSTAKGVSAIYTSYQMNYGPNAATGRGMKLMGSYQWNTMPVAELAQGHNSATTDPEGRSFVIYHTKFNDGTVGHQVRVHQLFLNQDGWLVTAPYEFAGETTTQKDIDSQEAFTTEEICGSYQIIRHSYMMDYENYAYNTPLAIALHADGTVTGNLTGSWKLVPGTSHIELVLNFVTYKGVLTRQTVDYTNIPAICLSLVSSSSGTTGATRGLSVWGSKVEPRIAIAYTLDHLQIPIKDGDQIYADLSLPRTGKLGALVSWTSDRPDIISASGKVTAPEETTDVTLTLQISKEGQTYSRPYKLTVVTPQGDCTTGLLAHYDFNNNLVNRINPTQSATLLAEASGTKPAIVQNATRGNGVLRQNFGYPSASSSSYTRFPNALQGAELTTTGATVSVLVQRTADNEWDAIWSFLDEDASDNISGRLYTTANTYLGFNGTGGWFDANYPSTDLNTLGTGEWHLFTVTFTSEGWTMYIDAKKMYTESSCIDFNSSSDFSDYASVLRLIASAPDFYFGWGSWWGSAPLLLDDLTLYSRALSDQDVASLYVALLNGTFTDITHIPAIEHVQPLESQGIFDLMGRRIEQPARGLYIINGKKVQIP